MGPNTHHPLSNETWPEPYAQQRLGMAVSMHLLHTRLVLSKAASQSSPMAMSPKALKPMIGLMFLMRVIVSVLIPRSLVMNKATNRLLPIPKILKAPGHSTLFQSLPAFPYLSPCKLSPSSLAPSFFLISTISFYCLHPK